MNHRSLSRLWAGRGWARGLASLGVLLACASSGVQAGPLPTDDGYRGIWYFNQPTRDEYRYKYSGGIATYPQQHLPIALYARAVNKTFFVYGGTTARSASDRQQLLHIFDLC